MRHSITVLRCPVGLWSSLLGLILGATLSAACAMNVGESRAAITPAAADPTGSGVDSVSGGHKFHVVTTLYPLEYFVGRIAGDLAEVLNLVAPGVQPHDFEPTPADIRRIAGADLVVYNGSGLEPWMDRALQATKRDGRVVVEASRGLAGTLGQGRDPHLWLDPLMAAQQVNLIRDGLIQADPANAGVYSQNSALVARQLEELHLRFQAGLADCKRNHFVTTHAAFGHMAQRYALEQVPIAGLSPNAQPSPRELAAIVDMVRELGITHVMVETITNARLAHTLAREVGADVLPMYSIESLTADEIRRGEDYFTLMDSNLENLRRALECKG